MKKIPIRVLLVEDNPGDARLIQEYLYDDDHAKVELDRVGSLKTGLEHLTPGKPDVILLDLGLPDSQGLETFIDVYAVAPEVPIVVLTGHDDAEQALEAVRAGAQDYLIKGEVNSSLLARAIRYAIERKQAEEVLRISEERFRSLYENVIVGMYRTTIDGRILMANPSLLRMLGFDSFDQLAQRNLEQGGHEPEYPRTQFLDAMAKYGVVMGLESAWRKQDGNTLFVRENASTIRDAQGQILYYDGTVEDITERKRTEAQLAERHATLKSLLESAITPVFSLDREYCYTSFNSAHAAVMKSLYGSEIEIGHNMLEYQPVLEDREEARKNLDRALHGEQFVQSAYSGESGGRRHYFEIAHNPIFDIAGDVIGVSVFASDITKRKQAEERIQRQLEHLTALSGIDRVISANFDLKLTLSEILFHVTKELGTDAADILIINSGLQMLEFGAERGFHLKGEKKVPVRVDGSFAGRAARERKLVQIPNLQEEPQNSRLAPHLIGEDFVFCISVPLIIKGQVKGVLETFHRAALDPDAEWLEFLNALAGQAAIAIENSILFESQQRSNSDLFIAYDATIEGWSRALDLRDRETEGHSKRVTEMTVKLVQEIGISETELVHVRWGALLHDIGKMGIPDGILLKPGPLTDEEWVIMKKHPSLAYELLAPIDYLRQALDIPYCHHEKWDGSGYPRGLKGDQIPLSARAFAVVDVWDALTSDRPYRAAWPESKAFAFIREQAGKHFDPRVVDIFLQQEFNGDR